MIVFSKIRWRNFLSTGDDWTEIQLDKSPSTLIVGSNGAGKSTLLDSLSFALFGKPHRNISKPQLVNSINGKNCVVEIEFKVGSHQFKIIRGIKPGIFEIYQNNKMINQSSSTRDYQQYLEKNILKLNHKSFHQIVVLGASSFIPFMQLSTGHRREVIEDLLDINIFSKMNSTLKEKMSILKEEFTDVTYKLDSISEKIELQKKFISDLNNVNTKNNDKILEEIEGFRQEIELLTNECTVINESIGDYQTLDKTLNSLKTKRDKFNVFISQFETQMKTLVKETKFYDEHNHCPTCDQDISPELKDKKKQESINKAKELKSASDKANQELTVINSGIDEISNQLKIIYDKQSDVQSKLSLISQLQKHIERKQSTIFDPKSSDNTELLNAKQSLLDLQKEKETISEKRLQVLESKTYYEVCAEMLKDSGIKTKIVKQYLPIMNTLINKYLQILDFFVKFTLDENFEECIKSRHRDDFNYSSFSEGEKMKIDLALLFTWRQIAKMKNSNSTNLLIMDEVMDSSLDQDGLDNFMKIVDSTLSDNNTNLFVISHRGDSLEGKFRSKIEFQKINNYSVMKKG